MKKGGRCRFFFVSARLGRGTNDAERQRLTFCGREIGRRIGAAAFGLH